MGLASGPSPWDSAYPKSPKCYHTHVSRFHEPAVPRAPEVSIVVPCRNKGRFLEESLESVWAQTHGDWELILVDDGSSDGSRAIARRHARRDPSRFRRLEHAGREHRGAFASRLLGARQARAPVIALLDADDVWQKDYLRRHLQFWKSLKDPKIALSYGPAILWFPQDPTGAADFAHAMPAPARAVFKPGELLQNFLSAGHNTEPRTSCSLIRRSAIIALARFESAARDCPAYEDDFLMWGLAARWPVAVHPNAWVRYRQRHLLSERPRSFFRRLDRDEASFLPVIRDFIARYHPRHPMLGPDGIQARLAALKTPGPAGKLDGYFFKRIPADLRRLAKASR